MQTPRRSSSASFNPDTVSPDLDMYGDDYGGRFTSSSHGTTSATSDMEESHYLFYSKSDHSPGYDNPADDKSFNEGSGFQLIDPGDRTQRIHFQEDQGEFTSRDPSTPSTTTAGMQNMSPHIYDSPHEDSDVSLDTGTLVDQQSEACILLKAKLWTQIHQRNVAGANHQTIQAQ
jgi:hypothetical protein